MSLGPSYVRLAARNPSFFDDLKAKLDQLSQNSQPVANDGARPFNKDHLNFLTAGGFDIENFYDSFKKRDEPIVPIRGGITGPFSIGRFGGSFYKRDKTIVPLQGGIAGAFSIDQYEGDFYKRDDTLPQVSQVAGDSTIVPLHGGIAGPFSIDSYDGAFYKREDTTPQVDQPAGDSTDSYNFPFYKRDDEFDDVDIASLKDIDNSAGGFAPGSWFDNFYKRGEDWSHGLSKREPDSVQSKTYQKMHRALKAATARELD